MYLQMILFANKVLYAIYIAKNYKTVYIMMKPFHKTVKLPLLVFALFCLCVSLLQKKGSGVLVLRVNVYKQHMYKCLRSNIHEQSCISFCIFNIDTVPFIYHILTSKLFLESKNPSIFIIFLNSIFLYKFPPSGITSQIYIFSRLLYINFGLHCIAKICRRY